MSEVEVVKEVISEILEKYPKARKIAVENFLASSVGYDYNSQISNLELDANLYKWNRTTIKAIAEGLHIMHKKGLLK
jgi:hypothetical protein